MHKYCIYSYRIYEKTQLTRVHFRNILILLKKQSHPSGIKKKEKKTQERKYLHQLAVHFCLACMNKSISAIWKCSCTYTKSSMDPDSMLELKWLILSGLTLEGDSGEEVALWLLTSLCTSAKREVEVALWFYQVALQILTVKKHRYIFTTKFPFLKPPL